MTAKVIGPSKVAMIQQMATEHRLTTKQPVVTLFDEGGVDDGAYYPPQSIRCWGEPQVRALRDACNEALGGAAVNSLRAIAADVKPPTP